MGECEAVRIAGHIQPCLSVDGISCNPLSGLPQMVMGAHCKGPLSVLKLRWGETQQWYISDTERKEDGMYIQR